MKQNHERALRPSFVSVLKVNVNWILLFLCFGGFFCAETTMTVMWLPREGRQSQAIISERLAPEGEARETESLQ